MVQRGPPAILLLNLENAFAAEDCQLPKYGFAPYNDHWFGNELWKTCGNFFCTFCKGISERRPHDSELPLESLPRLGSVWLISQRFLVWVSHLLSALYGQHRQEFPNAFSDVLHSPLVGILVRVPKALWASDGGGAEDRGLPGCNAPSTCTQLPALITTSQSLD